MTLTHLECFLAVAKLGSVNRAAEIMFLAQPTLTVRLQALENELGCQLFVRTKQGMKLTEAGRQFLPYAERSVANFEGGKQYLKELQAGREGDLRLGVLPRVSTYILPPLLERFALSHPQVLISIHTGHSQYILEMVLREEVQLGLARPIDHPEVESISLYEEELVLVVDSRHRFVKHDHIDLKELGQEQLILFDRASSNYELTKSLLRGTGVQPRVIELDNIEAAKRMVEHRLGVAFLPQQAVVRAVKAGRLCVIGVNEGPNLKRSIAALRRIDLPLTGAAEAFLRIVIKASKSLC